MSPFVRWEIKLTESSLLDDLNGIPFDLTSDASDNASGSWLTLKTFFLNILNKHAPIKTIRVRGNNLLYVTAEVKSLMIQRDYLRGKANKTGSKYLRQAYQQSRNKVDYTLRKLKSDYYTKKIEENKDNLKNTWRVLKNVTNRSPKCTSIDQIRVHECLVVDKQQISEKMIFQQLGSSWPRTFLKVPLHHLAWCRNVVQF